ncbi:MAG: zinc-binding dehydrogenase [Acidobacteriota bacterium]|nr:MAG: zinc-binding dehydrogenase [Acidobacteriota bacterium]
MDARIPTTMKALVLERHDPDAARAVRSLELDERPVPQPGRGQVLVRVEAAPCNPSDLLFLQGLYGVEKTLPTVPGWEGAGTVVASGGGMLGRWLVGKTVACGGQEDRDGTWSQYALFPVSSCAPLGRELTVAQGATMLVNPLTAMGLHALARGGGHRAAVQNAAASQVGRMLVRLAAEAGLPLVNIVRRAEQAELLRSLGAEHVLDSSEPSFHDQLTRACRDMDVTIAFDAIGGEATGLLVDAMRPRAHVVVYGALSEQPCSGIDPIAVIFRDKRVQGFYLGAWLQKVGFLRRLRILSQVRRLIASGHLETVVQRQVGLESAVEALLEYLDRPTDGKILIRPHGPRPLAAHGSPE